MLKAFHLLFVATVFFLTGCSSLPSVVTSLPESENTVSHQAYIVSHGWHTGIIVPAKKMNVYVPSLSDRFSDGNWYEFGWGDKGFYQAQEVTSGLTLQAMFWSSGAVMHVVSVPTNPQQFFRESDVFGIQLTDNQLNSLMRFIANSFEKDEQEKIIPLKRGIYGNSQFYAAVGRYYILNTCNKWTAKGLKSAGMDISPTFKLTSSSVMDYLKDNQVNKQHAEKTAVPCTTD
ncbi:TIGR02117 family protein [Pragia fontium]|uniref:TIGR02117 family protein n=1 Tax=Pragia fontium DSM 5563 = ATCC 49100 TaxID=1122977 RepID=A0AAJ5BHX8_9GAMM|nr:TIGR02117 family protein [Pragia fontium]SFD13664.1 conserved hypothetical protein [Pragia fontium DSM 5563 = ATCC 49100]